MMILIAIYYYLSNKFDDEKIKNEDNKQNNTNNSNLSDSGSRLYNHIKLNQ